MHPYYQPLALTYQQHANPGNALIMKKYLKDHFEFLGIKTEERTRLNRAFFAEHGLPAYSELPDITDSLLEQPQREYHYFAITLVTRMKKFWNEGTWKLLEKLILTHSWWDTVDPLAANTCGQYFRKFPSLIQPVTAPWNQSDNMWLIRSSILFQLRYKEDTDQQLLFAYLEPHLDSNEFFIQKAIGWALRQYARVNPAAVRAFVQQHEMAPLSRREAQRGLAD